MRWSGPLDELRRRYLKQQAELGGEEVILAEPMAAFSSPPTTPRPCTCYRSPWITAGWFGYTKAARAINDTGVSGV